MPHEFELAELVTLYKKGSVEDFANYRPIALLNTIYSLDLDKRRNCAATIYHT